MAAHDHRLGEPLVAGEGEIGRPRHGRHGIACDTARHRRQAERQGQRREQNFPRRTEARRRQPAELTRKDQHQDEAQNEGRNGPEGHRAHEADAVRGSTRLEAAEEADDRADQQRQAQAPPPPARPRRQAGPELMGHRTAGTSE